MVICLERGEDLHMAQLMPLPLTVSCSSKIQIDFTFLVPAYPDCPGKEAVKWLYITYRFSTPNKHTVTTSITFQGCSFNCLQYFDAVGWAAGRASGL